MIDGLKIMLIDYNWDKKADKIEKVEDVVHLFALCFHCLWW